MHVEIDDEHAAEAVIAARDGDDDGVEVNVGDDVGEGNEVEVEEEDDDTVADDVGDGDVEPSWSGGALTAGPCSTPAGAGMGLGVAAVGAGDAMPRATTTRPVTTPGPSTHAAERA